MRRSLLQARTNQSDSPQPAKSRDQAPLPLRFSVRWMLLANFVYAACQGCLLFIIAKIGNVEAVGQFSLALAVNTPVFMFTQLNARQIYVTDVSREFKLADFIWLRLLTLLVAAVILCVITLACNYATPINELVAILYVSKAFESLSDIIHGGFQKLDRIDRAASSILLKSTLGIVLFTAAFLTTGDIVYSSLFMAGCSGCALVLMDIPRWCSSQGVEPLLSQFDAKALRTIIGRSLPLGLSAGFISIASSMPRYMLEAFVGVEAVGMYALAYAPLNICALVAESIRVAILGRASRFFHARELHSLKRLAKKLTTTLVLATSAASVGFLVFGQFAVDLLFGPEFRPVYPCLVILSVGQIIGSFAVSGSTIFNSSHRYWLNPIAACIGLVTLVPAGMLLTPLFGLYGMAAAASLRYIASTLFVVLVCRRILLDLDKDHGSVTSPAILKGRAAA